MTGVILAAAEALAADRAISGGASASSPPPTGLQQAAPIASCIARWNRWVYGAGISIGPSAQNAVEFALEADVTNRYDRAFVATLPPGARDLANIGPTGTCMIFWVGGSAFATLVLARSTNGDWNDVGNTLPQGDGWLATSIETDAKRDPNVTFDPSSYTLAPYPG